MKQFAVIGCGQFGSSVALTLSGLGHEVMVVDTSEEIIDGIADQVAHAVVADITVDGTMRDLGIANFDVVIIGMSTSYQASIIATIAAKDLGVGTVVAKVRDMLQGRVLRKVGADKIIIPERDIGVRLAHHLTSSNTIEFIELSDEYSFIEIAVPKVWIGKSIIELGIRDTYEINVVAIKDEEGIHINPKSKYIFKDDDRILVIGMDAEILKLEDISNDD